MNSPLTTRLFEPLFRQHEEVFARLSDLLIEENKKVNLTRITDPRRIRVRHILDSLAALPVLDAAAEGKAGFSCIDIGSGAGFPGLPLAIARPQWSFVSVEATGKKAVFQQKACEALGLSNVQVIAGRAEELAHERAMREKFDAALARAVADLSILAELMLGFVNPGGLAIAWKGPDAEAELQAAQGAFRQMGCRAAETVSYLLEEEFEPSRPMTLVTACKRSSSPASLPRRFVQIKKYPLH